MSLPQWKKNKEVHIKRIDFSFLLETKFKFFDLAFQTFFSLLFFLTNFLLTSTPY
jgi:hypothetical protein